MMAKQLDPQIAEVLKSFGYGRDAAWDCHGTWVVYHRVIEQIAAKAGIVFEPPIVLEANSPAKCAAICVTGVIGDKREWSIGEAAPGNNKNAYPYAMAEKRAKDRVVLKLIGLHGLVYSEDEADNFTAAGGRRDAPDPTPLFLELRGTRGSMSEAGIKKWAETVKDLAARKVLPDHELAELRTIYADHVANLKQQKAA
jgi:hypothetical protein